jgi:hypothetical protein
MSLTCFEQRPVTYGIFSACVVLFLDLAHAPSEKVPAAKAILEQGIRQLK